MSVALTKRIVLTTEPKGRPYELRDTRVRGLILRVQPFGHKAWIVTCKARGQDKITPINPELSRTAMTAAKIQHYVPKFLLRNFGTGK